MAGARSSLQADRRHSDANAACAGRRHASASKISPLAYPFCLLPENRLAHTAIEMFCVLPVDASPQLIFLYGPSGTGKTHLSTQLQRQMSLQQPDLSIRFQTCHDFIQDLHQALGSSGIDQFRNQLSKVDLWILEDLMSIERSPKAQEILTWALDELGPSGGRVLITCRKSPGDLAEIPLRLRSRLRSGIVASLELPSKSSRQQLLAHFASQQGMDLGEDVITMLAEEVTGSPRELDGILKQLRNAAQFAPGKSSKIDADFTREYLASQHQESAPSLPQIASCVATQFGVTVKAMKSRSRDQQITIARQTAIWLARQTTRHTLKSIGEHFGLSNHTTVMHACKVVAERSEKSPAYDHELHRLRQKLIGLPIKPR